MLKKMFLFGLLMTLGATLALARMKTTPAENTGIARHAITASARFHYAPMPNVSLALELRAQDDDSPCKRFPRDQVFDSFDKAFKAPDKVRCLVPEATEESGLSNARHLPAGLGKLVNLEVLSLACLEHLQDLPDEIGSLTRLEELIIDNGNGCSMNIAVPASIAKLQNLKVLRLYGALDARDIGHPNRAYTPKTLPGTIGDLRKLEILDLGRNGLKTIPLQIGRLSNLKELRLSFNELRQLADVFVDLKNLKELSLDGNKIPDLPASLAKIEGVKISMGNNSLKLVDQKRLQAKFPKAIFSFESEFDDPSANETPKSKPKT